MLKYFLPVIIIILFSLTAYAEDTIVAKVNGTVFTMKDLEAQVDRLIPLITFHKQVSPEKRKNYYDKAMEELINRELLYQDAVSKGIKPEKEKVDSQIKKMKEKFKSQEMYKEALDKQGLTEDTLRAATEKEFVIQSIVKKTVTEPSQMTEANLKEYYDKNIKEFKKPEAVKLRLLSSKDENKALEMLKKLKAGEDIGQVANSMSEDESRSKGGDLGYIHKGRLMPEIDQVAFSLIFGGTSDLIHVGDMWYIVKVEDKLPERTLPFEEVKGKLEKELEAQKANELQGKWIGELKSKAKIEILLQKAP
jgi:parvulin-like peptidyl-prolyl isomerase